MYSGRVGETALHLRGAPASSPRVFVRPDLNSVTCAHAVCALQEPLQAPASDSLGQATTHRTELEQQAETIPDQLAAAEGEEVSR